MNRRTEPRFQVYALARIALFDYPESESSGELVDVSGAGLRVLVPEAIAPEQMITVETDQHLILAEVRSSAPQGNKFSLGAERVHSAAKLSLPRTASRAERNQVLVEDFHRRLRAELDNPPELTAARATAAAERFKSNYPPPAAEKIEAQTPPEMISAALAIEPPPAEVIAIPQQPKPVPIEPEVSAARNEKPAAEPVAALSAEAVSPATVNAKVAATPAALKSDAVNPASLPAVSSPKEVQPVPVPQPEKKPEGPVKEFLYKPEIGEAKDRARSRLFAVLIAAGLTIAAIVGLSVGPFARGPSSPPPVSAKNSAAPVMPSPPPTQSPSSKTEAAAVKPHTTAPPAAPATAGISHAVITASDRSWVTACTDGKPAFSKLFVDGSKDGLAFSERALIRTGSAGSIAIALNGKPVGSLGRVGQVVIVELSPTGFRFAKPGETGDCTQ